MSAKLNIGQVARLLGISNELLRHYERKGLITPYRDEKGYRYYGIEHVYALTGVRRFRNMGFSLEDVERLIYGGTHGETLEMLAIRCRELEEEIFWKQLVLEATQALLEESQSLPERSGQCGFCKNPPMLRLPDRISTNPEENALARETLDWVDKMPVVWISPSFSMEGVVEGTAEKEFGYAVPLHLAKTLGLESTPGAVELPPVDCVSVVVHSCGDSYLSAQDLRVGVEFMGQHRFHLANHPWGLTIGNYTQEGIAYRFHKMFLPIQSD